MRRSVLILLLGALLMAAPLKASPLNDLVDYSKYGRAENTGTSQYKYVITDMAGLSQAAGTGIFPNDQVKNDDRYKELKKSNRLKGGRWEHIDSDDPEADFFIWATANEEPGVKLYFTAEALRHSGRLVAALKAYDAVLVHFPRSVCWAKDKSFVWYVGQAAIDKINIICRDHPELELRLVHADVDVRNGRDTNLKNDIITVNPGEFVRYTKADRERDRIDLSKTAVIQRRGKGKVQLVQYANGHWQMAVDGQPFMVKGVTYNATRIGQSPHNHTLANWQWADDNNNGRIDGPYDSWVDRNKNGKQDKDEPVTGDFQLMKDMGVNAIRVYEVCFSPEEVEGYWNKELLRDLYKNYGIKVIMGDFIGAYTIGSGADWNDGTDYKNPEECQRMKQIVREMVLQHKDEPYVLMWLLGNENNMAGTYTGVNASRTNAGDVPKEYALFLNDCAKMIHELDPNHPVAIGNVETNLLDFYAAYAPEIDIIGINSYRGADGFGHLWLEARRMFDRPVLITEYGCDAYNNRRSKPDEVSQALYHQGCWHDLAWNAAAGGGTGNAIGGVIFEWCDEWWKSLQDSPDNHSEFADCDMPFRDGCSNEEWYGVVSQGDGEDSPYLRQLRESYLLYQKMWK